MGHGYGRTPATRIVPEVVVIDPKIKLTGGLCLEDRVGSNFKRRPPGADLSDQ
jgi:hypothetical protein